MPKIGTTSNILDRVLSSRGLDPETRIIIIRNHPKAYTCEPQIYDPACIRLCRIQLVSWIVMLVSLVGRLCLPLLSQDCWKSGRQDNLLRHHSWATVLSKHPSNLNPSLILAKSPSFEASNLTQGHGKKCRGPLMKPNIGSQPQAILRTLPVAVSHG